MNTLLLLNKIFFKKLCKIFGQLKKVFYFCAWRDGRVVDCGGLENRWAARLRGFESLSLRKTKQVRGIEKSMPFVFHAIRQTCLSGRHGKQKIAACGLLRGAGLARAPAASRRERARGAKRTASKAWPITENFTRKQIQIVSLFEVPSPQDQQDKRYRKVSLIFFNIHWQGHCRKHRATEYLSLFLWKWVWSWN